jgi:hypothetical protein
MQEVSDMGFHVHVIEICMKLETQVLNTRKLSALKSRSHHLKHAVQILLNVRKQGKSGEFEQGLDITMSLQGDVHRKSFEAA